MHASVNCFTGIIWFPDLSAVFQAFDIFSLFILSKFIAFPRLSMSQTSMSGLSIPENEII